MTLEEKLTKLDEFIEQLEEFQDKEERPSFAWWDSLAEFLTLVKDELQ